MIVNDPRLPMPVPEGFADEIHKRLTIYQHAIHAPKRRYRIMWHKHPTDGQYIVPDSLKAVFSHLRFLGYD